jgi:hypothetical protein
MRMTTGFFRHVFRALGAGLLFMGTPADGIASVHEPRFEYRGIAMPTSLASSIFPTPSTLLRFP